MDGLTVRNYDHLLTQSQGVSKKNGEFTQNNATQMDSSKTVQSFSELLKESIDSVDRLQKKSDLMMEKLATGKTDNIPEVMIAAERADIALKLMVQVRNKVIDAYQEIMKMQV